jgi:glutaryl-CoA dehydrogenase
MDCYDSALRYSKERIQFDRPIGGFQLQQKKLAEMVTEITKAQLMVHRLGQLKNEGKATTAQISMAKRNSVDMALKFLRTWIYSQRFIVRSMSIMWKRQIQESS